MANRQLPDFLTAENELNGQEVAYIAQNGKTRKSTLQKIKEFIIGTVVMGTTATNVTGAVKEINDKVGGIDVENNGDIATQLNAMANNKLDKTAYISKSTSLTLLNNWIIETGTAEVCREGKLVSIRANIKGGTTIDSTIITVLPEEYRPKETCMLPFISCDATYNYISGYLMVYMNGQVVIGGSAKNTRVIINATFNL